MKPVVHFENVSKRYYLGSQRAYIRYLLPDFMQSWLDGRQPTITGAAPTSSELWALKNVSFKAQPGEVLGIIGANGAGKTTTLSLLAGIISPTSGRIAVRGRVGALIKLGAGFHPDLSGRENVYLNGAILGLRKAEIDRLYDDIVQFAELDAFMDTPVKRYSSGMYVRLGFSVAVHINPEILLVDEILSVGDMSFQTKCFNRIGQIRDKGTTIIFVSHNMHHITSFCDRVVYLNKGVIENIGEPGEVLAAYTSDIMSKTANESISDGSDFSQVNGTGKIVITNVVFLDKAENPVSQIRSGDPVTVRAFYCSVENVKNPLLDVVIRDSASGNMFQATNRDFGVEFGRMSKTGYIDIMFTNIVSNNQVLNFFFTFWDSNHTEQFDWKRFIKLQVAGNPSSSGRVMFDCEWQNINA